VTVTVVNSPPDTPTIFLPAGGITLQAKCETDFLGQTYDLEDGYITSTGLVWNSDLDGPIGTGLELKVDFENPDNPSGSFNCNRQRRKFCPGQDDHYGFEFTDFMRRQS
jgi:hypothetical protein